MLKNKAELEKLLEYVQKNAKAVLLSIEKDITEIQRRAIYERGNQADLVRGGQDVLPRNQGGERQEVSARPADVRVSGGAVARSDGRGAGADEQADRVLRQEMAGVYGGELSSGHSGAEGQNVVGADTEADRQGSRGNGVEFGAGVREEQSPSAHVSRNSAVGEDEVARSQSQSDDGNRPQTARINNSAEADKAPADFVSEKSFAEQVDASLNGTLPFYTSLKVCDTPKILLDIGCEQLPMLYTQKHLNEAVKPKTASHGHTHAHGLDVDKIKQMPKLLAEPVMVLDSLTKNDSIIVVTSEIDNDNLPIIASIKTNGSGIYELENIDANFITSIYGRNGFESFINRTLQNDALLYYDKNKSQELFSCLGLQSSEAINNLDPNIIIHQSRNIVKGSEEKISEDRQNFEQITLDSAPERATYSTNPTAAEPVNEEPPADLDKFYVNPETEQVTWIYYNPDSSAGGQLVYTYFDFDDILTASEKDNPLDYLLETSKQTVLDKGMDGFDEAVAEFMTNSESISNRDENYLEKLIALSEQKKNRATYSTIPAEPQEKHDFRITEDTELGAGGAKTKFAANIAAIRTLKAIESEKRLATPDEQQILAKYVGWGGLSQAFDSGNGAWTNEYKQLRALLTDDEYKAAAESTLNAHYTSPEVIGAMYKALDNFGFESGNVLEPSMGVGNFFGCLPEKMRGSKLYGVELDDITGRIAKQLYQTADIQINGFEKTDFPDNFFDAAIGNVPFGNYGISDARYNKENFLVHDYFFAKTLDKVAPGGVVAFITSKGTLDKANPKVREYLAKRADLIGAIRLPNNAFKGASTEVTSDIIFLQKREKMAVELPDWCYTAKNSDGITVNQYFIDNPEMVLGKLEFTSGQFGQEVTCSPIEGEKLSEQLNRAVSRLRANVAVQKRAERQDKERGFIPATADVRNFTHALVDGKMYFRENNIMTEVSQTGKDLERMKGLHELRLTMRELIDAQSQNCTDDELHVLQNKLNEQYDSFVKNYSSINDRANALVFREDDDYNTLCSLENVDPEKKTAEKSDIFTQRTIKPSAEISHVDTPQEALQVSIDMKGRVDIEFMAELCGNAPETVASELSESGMIYLNPEKYAQDKPFEGYEEASEYLSGNVREKLRAAEIYAEKNPELFARNAAGLADVLPPTIGVGDITAHLGASWVDVADYEKFLKEYLGRNVPYITLRRTVSGEYKLENKTADRSVAATNTFGTERMSAYFIFENLLNHRDVTVKDRVDLGDDKYKYVVNQKQTQLAAEKARQMNAAFSKWLWSNPERREKYVTRYNELFNSIVGRHFDGSHQTLPGMSPFIQLKPHQKDAVARAKFGGNTLLAHCVGAGKSFEMIAATMEKKRLGLINKACVVVPKALVGQTANEWLRLYPQAKILVAADNDFSKDNRQKFIGRCCTGDYAAVVMSYEQFEKIPMSVEYRQQFLQKELDNIQAGLDELHPYRDRTSIKDLQREQKRIKAKIEKLLDTAKTKDTSLTFEQLGFDSLVVDEAHNYKNGLVITKMNNVSGVQTTAAQKSEDILMKTQYLNENFGEKNILFATGTPAATPYQHSNTKLNINACFIGNRHNLNHR